MHFSCNTAKRLDAIISKWCEWFTNAFNKLTYIFLFSNRKTTFFQSKQVEEYSLTPTVMSGSAQSHPVSDIPDTPIITDLQDLCCLASFSIKKGMFKAKNIVGNISSTNGTTWHKWFWWIQEMIRKQLLDTFRKYFKISDILMALRAGTCFLGKKNASKVYKHINHFDLFSVGR